MPRFIADENFPHAVIDVLRHQRHDVLSVKESMRSASDEQILERAQKDSRIVLTLDKDFGDLAYRWGLDARCGVVLFRLRGRAQSQVRRMLAALESRSDWSGEFTTVTDARMRTRHLLKDLKYRKPSP